MTDYSITIKIKKDAEKLYRCILPEIENNDRCKVTLELKEGLTIKIEARDITSMRAFASSVMNSIAIFEKTK